MLIAARSHIALLLTTIYLVIVTSPLAPLALRSPVIAHAVTGECVGNCDICGCSPAQRADRTCCCWRKKQRHDREQERTVANCCQKKRPDSTPILSCGCPCGGSKMPGLWGGEKFELLLYHFTEGTTALHEDEPSAYRNDRLRDRYREPPDPPPKLHFPV